MSQENAQAAQQQSEISPESRRRAFRMHLLKTALVIGGVSLLNFFLADVGLLKGWETPALDTWRRLRAPLQTRHVRIVGITEDDYNNEDLFNETSPLNPRKVQEIIEAIARGQPRVIGVDLDTSAKKFKQLQPSSSWPPVIWARDAVEIDQNTFEPREVLAGRNVSLSGIARLPQDPDSMLRHYRRAFNTKTDLSAPSFPWAVVKVFCSERQGESEGCRNISEGEREHDIWLLHLSPSMSACDKVDTPEPKVRESRAVFPCLSASDVLKASKGEGWYSKGPLKDKIVLLGGLYQAARDEYLTPLGSMQGVLLIAQAIESELQGKLIPRPSAVFMILLNILGGLLFAALSSFKSLRPYRFTMLFLRLLTIFILALGYSLIAYQSLGLWIYFVPVQIGVLIQELYVMAKDSPKKQIDWFQGPINRT